MDAAVLSFFSGHEGALPLYAAWEEKLLAAFPDAAIKVQKTQISFYLRHLFVCVSFLPVRGKAQRPPAFITVTFGLPSRLDSPRVDSACAPYPNRWTHHVLIGSPEEIDGELMGWIAEAAAFANRKP